MKKTRPSDAGKPFVLSIRRAPGQKSRALIQFANTTIPAAIGRSGRTAFKREGDGGTPIAAMKLLYGFTRGDRVRALKTTLPMRRTRKDMLWCDQPENPNYNRLVKAPFKASHEEMARKDDLYDVCLVLDWNVTSRRRHGGSAIFFHLKSPGYTPTAGCIAVSLGHMRRLLGVLQRGSIVRVV